MKELTRFAFCLLLSLALNAILLRQSSPRPKIIPEVLLDVSAVIVDTDSILDVPEEASHPAPAPAPTESTPQELPTEEIATLPPTPIEPLQLPPVADSALAVPKLPPVSKPPQPAPKIVPTPQPTPPPTVAQQSSPPPRVIAPPQVRNRITIQYPMRARQRRQEGSVRLEAKVDTDGRCRLVTLLKSSGYDSLDEVAIKAFKRALFLPATSNGVPVEAVVRQTITFRLSGVSVAP